MVRFSSPVRFSSTAAFWPARPMRERSCAASRTTSRPATWAVPASGERSVERMRTVVVLPAPLGPSTPRTVPGAASSSTPSSARTSPNDFTRPCTEIAASKPAGFVGRPAGVGWRECITGPSQRFRSASVRNVRDPRLVAETTSSRLLTLLSLLQGRRDWPGQELADRLEVSGRTVRRDVDRLRELGFPVESLTGPAGGYRLAAGAAMPPLLLDDEEAIAIAVGLRTAARASVTGIEETSVRALVKLEQVLPAHLRRRVQALGAVTTTLSYGGGPTADPQVLTLLAAACRDRERLRFGYQAREGERSRREAEPHALVNVGRRWYLVAWDCGRKDWRTFRVDRLTRPHASGRFQPRELPAKDAATFVSRSLRARPNRYEARLTLHASAEEMRKRAPRYVGPFEPLGEDRCEYRTGDDNLEWLGARLAMLGVEFEVHEPPELIEHLQALAARLARAAQPA